jgi:hypothetical protein
MSVDNPGVEEGTVTLPEEAPAKERIREQDVRTVARRNGRTSHLVGSAEVGEPPVPTEPDEHGDHLPDGHGSSRVKNLVYGSVYLLAGTVALYIGVLMIRDAFKEDKSK